MMLLSSMGLTIELSSDNFASGNETELFEIIVMEHKQPKGRRGYAIDRFPKMKYEEIEDALRRKVKITV